MKFTKGEWKMGDNFHSYPEPFSIHAPNRCIATIVQHTQSKEHYNEAVANAHLIAQAPRMYGACKEALEKSHNPEVECILMKAIAKVENDQQAGKED